MAKAKKTENEVRSEKLSAGDLFFIEQNGDKSFEEIAEFLDKPLADVRAYGAIVMEKERNKRNKIRIQDMSNSYKGTVSATEALSSFNQEGDPWGRGKESFAKKIGNPALELEALDAQINDAIQRKNAEDVKSLMRKRSDIEIEAKNKIAQAGKYENSVHKPFDD